MTSLEWHKLEATVANMTPDEKQRLLGMVTASLSEPTHQVPLDPSSFQAELEQVAFDAPGLPEDFSRADIFIDHD